MIIRDECATSGWPGAPGGVSLGSDSHLRVSDICAMLKVDRHTVYKWIENGLIESRTINARVTFIPRASLERLLAPPADKKT